MQSKQAGNRIRQRHPSKRVAQSWIAARRSANHCTATGLADTDATPRTGQDAGHFVSGFIACALLTLATSWLSAAAPALAQQSPASGEQSRAGSNTQVPNSAPAAETDAPATTSALPSADNSDSGASMASNTTTTAMDPSSKSNRPSPNYEPSENISEDSSVSFPVDI